MAPETSRLKVPSTRMRALTAWGGALLTFYMLKEQVLRAVGALRALARRLFRRGLSPAELEALSRLVRAQQAQAEADSLRRNVEVLDAVLGGRVPVPEGMLLEVEGRIYPPGSWVRRTLRVIQGGLG